MIYVELLTKVFLIIAGLSYTLKLTMDKDLFDYIGNKTVVYIILICIGLSTIYNVINRDYYLSFLGKSVIPIKLGQQKTENAKMIDVVLENLPKQTTVIFWAASKQEGQKDIMNYMDAYADYSNSGIAQTDENGRVVVQIECPVEYTVPKFGMFKYKLDKHIHYRYQLPNKKGLYSRIYTQSIKC